MNWSESVKGKFQWCGEISNLAQKEKVAQIIADKVIDGQTIGFGSGSTAYLAVKAIGLRAQQEGLNISAIPTSHEIADACSFFGIKVTSLTQKKPDWCFDGADEVDPHGWLIKGRGAAMFKEKLIMKCCNERYILVDDSKLVDKLCSKYPIPIECHPDSFLFVKQSLIEMGASSCDLRLAKRKDGPVITENGNFIIDTMFPTVNSELENEIKKIVGVIESGLFIGYNVQVINPSE